LDLKIQLEVLGQSLNKLQPDNITLADVLDTWNDLLTNPKLQQYNKNIKEKSENHALYFITDPKYRKQQNKLNGKTITDAEDWLNEREKGLLPTLLAFQMKDVHVFPKNMFGDMVMEKMTGLKYWRIMKTKIINEKKNSDPEDRGSAFLHVDDKTA
jgi:hypothetical protein